MYWIQRYFSWISHRLGFHFFFFTLKYIVLWIPLSMNFLQWIKLGSTVLGPLVKPSLLRRCQDEMVIKQLNFLLYLFHILRSILVSHVGRANMQLEVWPKILKVIIIWQFYQKQRQKKYIWSAQYPPKFMYKIRRHISKEKVLSKVWSNYLLNHTRTHPLLNSSSPCTPGHTGRTLTVRDLTVQSNRSLIGPAASHIADGVPSSPKHQ